MLILLFCSCNHNNEQNTPSPVTTGSDYTNITPSNDDYKSTSTSYTQTYYHTDTRYKYEYRTGNSGNYEYNYDISGSDENGNGVYGNINIQGKYGSGYIEDENGNEKYVDVEWIDYGVLEGTDEDGNSYEFDVDE